MLLYSARALWTTTSKRALKPSSLATYTRAVATLPAPKKPEYRVLSIDGGGIRGIIPAMILTEIERRTGKPIAQLFNYMGGTSTGGILALGLNVPRSSFLQQPKYSAKELYNLYKNHGDEIFHRPYLHKMLTGFSYVFVYIFASIPVVLTFIATDYAINRELWKEGSEDEIIPVKNIHITGMGMGIHTSIETELSTRGKARERKKALGAFFFLALLSITGVTAVLITVFTSITMLKFHSKFLIKNKYSGAPLREILYRYFGSTSMSEALKEVFVPTYDVKNQLPRFLTRHAAKQNHKDNLFMRHAAYASSAAPTYFNPFTNEDRIYVDGGIFSNNPAAHIFADALKYTDANNIFMLSLGTGYYPFKGNRHYFNYGLFQWILRGRLIQTMLNASSDATHWQMDNILGDRYIRIDPTLSRNIGLDHASKRIIRHLTSVGEHWITENNALLDEVCERLLKSAEMDAPEPDNNSITERPS